MNIISTKKAIEQAISTYAYDKVYVNAIVSQENTNVCSYDIEYGYAEKDGKLEKLYYSINLTVEQYSSKQKVIWVTTSGMGIPMNTLNCIIKSIEKTPVK